MWLPSSGALQHTAGESMTVNNFSQQAVVSFCSHCIHILLQHHLKSVGFPALIAFNFPLGSYSYIASYPVAFLSQTSLQLSVESHIYKDPLV